MDYSAHYRIFVLNFLLEFIMSGISGMLYYLLIFGLFLLCLYGLFSYKVRYSNKKHS